MIAGLVLRDPMDELPPLGDNAVWERLVAMGGRVTEVELRYSLRLHGRRFSAAELEELIEAELVIRRHGKLEPARWALWRYRAELAAETLAELAELAAPAARRARPGSSTRETLEEIARRIRRARRV